MNDSGFEPAECGTAIPQLGVCREPRGHLGPHVPMDRRQQRDRRDHGLDGEGRGIVFVDGNPIPFEPATLTVIVPVPIGEGCINDSAEDRPGYRAVFEGRVASGLTPEAAGGSAFLLARAEPRRG